MKRKLQKMTAGILAALLIAGSVQIMPVGQVQAQGGYSETVSDGDEATSDGIVALAAGDEEYELITYTKDQLTFVERWNSSATAAMPFTFRDDCNEIWFHLPEDVDMSQCEEITFAVSSQNGTLAFKLYDSGANEKKAFYNCAGDTKYVKEPGISDVVHSIGIMDNDDQSGTSVDFESITFKVKASSEEEKPEYELITYTKDQLTFVERWNSSATAAMPFTFRDDCNEIWFHLPEDVDMSQCEEITFAVSSQNGTLAFKLYDSGANEKKAFYNCAGDTKYVKEPGISDVVHSIGIMDNDDQSGTSVDFESITFKVKALSEEQKPKYELITYTKDQLTFVERWNSSATAAMPFTFRDDCNEIWFHLPEDVDMSQCEEITFAVSSQNGTLAFKLYDSGANEKKAFYNCAGDTKYVKEPGISDVVHSIGIMDNDDQSGTSVDFESITFKVKASSEEEKPEYEFVTYSVAEDNLTFSERWYGAAASMPYSYSDNFEEIWFQLPEAVDMDRCVEVTFTVSDQGGAICFKLYAGGESIKDFYSCAGSTEYVRTPGVSGKVTAIGIMANDENATYPFSVNFESVSFKLIAGSGEEEEPKDIPFNENLIKNPDFADADNLDVWRAESNGAVISSETADSPIYGNVTTYGKITNRNSNYQCFAQDVTEILEKGQEYQFSFWVMLDPEDYKDAPESQRTVEISPYITANGSTSYGAGVSGTTKQAIAPGEWVQFTGTYKPNWGGSLEKAVIRILEQGENYGQGAGVHGTYYVTGVDLRKIQKEKPEIEQGIPQLKDSITAALGAGTIVGTAVTADEMSDETLMQLVEKHFNAVTFGNELKLQTMVGNNSKLKTETVTFNNAQLEVPILNFGTADGMLDQILKWNEENPDNQIKVRGHVLVWHSQAPTTFFREGYDASGDYVSKDVMDQRLEWYIKTMLEYYTGESSKYKDLFYGWDVVNEAINDGTSTYRSSGESDWANIYGSQSNEYIIKAFRWANKYAPSTLELYYNDYNDSTPSKRDGIVKLLQAVKAAEGTRIDGMGMQAHYDMSSPSIAQFEAAARAYAAVVGKVQLTELDFKASSDYDGTDATKDAEYTKQAYRYKDFYDAIKRLKADGVDFTGITIWGVVDKYSWLNDQNNVGGGSNGGPQCPLLFDDNYKAKPAFWAFVNPSELKPSIQKLTVIEDQGQGYNGAKEYSFGDGTVEVSFCPMWKNNTLKVQVTVKDATVDDNDSITLYFDEANLRSEYNAQQRATAMPKKVTVNRKDPNVKTVSGGYQTEFSIPVSNITVAKKIGFDIRVANGDTLVSYNDYNNTQDTSSEYYAEAVFKPYALVGNGTAVVDGNKEAVWTEKGQEIPLTINLGSQVSATVTALWDEEYLYIFAEVKDAVLNNDSANEYEQDSLEVFIDENNHKSDAYEEDDKQYRISYTNYQSFNGEKCVKENVTSVTKVTADGYVIEAAYKWTDITPKAGMEIGLEFQINDANDTGKRIGTLSWYDETGMGWSSPGVYGTVKLVGEKEEDPKPSEPPSPAPSPNPTPSPELAPDSQGSAQNGSPVSPPTGDRSGIALITALLCLMGFALSAGKVYRLRKKIK